MKIKKLNLFTVLLLFCNITHGSPKSSDPTASSSTGRPIEEPVGHIGQPVGCAAQSMEQQVSSSIEEHVKQQEESPRSPVGSDKSYISSRFSSATSVIEPEQEITYTRLKRLPRIEGITYKNSHSGEQYPSDFSSKLVRHDDGTVHGVIATGSEIEYFYPGNSASIFIPEKVYRFTGPFSKLENPEQNRVIIVEEKGPTLSKLFKEFIESEDKEVGLYGFPCFPEIERYVKPVRIIAECSGKYYKFADRFDFVEEEILWNAGVSLVASTLEWYKLETSGLLENGRILAEKVLNDKGVPCVRLGYQLNMIYSALGILKSLHFNKRQDGFFEVSCKAFKESSARHRMRNAPFFPDRELVKHSIEAKLPDGITPNQLSFEYECEYDKLFSRTNPREEKLKINYTHR